MSRVKELKEYADNHGIEYAKNYGVKKMENAIESAGHEVPSEVLNSNIEPQKEVVDFSLDLKQAKDLYENSFKVELHPKTRKHVKVSDIVAKNRSDQFNAALLKRIKESGDSETLKAFLQWQRSRKIMAKGDEYALNELEQAECTQMCEHYQMLNASGLKVQIGMQYPCKVQFDAERQTDMYVIYVNEVKEAEDQISPALASKMAKGFAPDPSDYAEPKTLWHRWVLRESEFLKYFRLV